MNVAPSTGTAAVHGPRSWPGRVRAQWRRSLRFRTLAATLVLTVLTILIALVWMALAIRNDLFDSRVQQVLGQAQRATESAQATLDAVEVSADTASAQNLLANLAGNIQREAGTDAIAVFRSSDAPLGTAAQDFYVPWMSASLLTDGLREAVRTGPDLQWWQSVEVPRDGQGPTAGIVVGQQLIVPQLGEYELYLGYEFAAEDETLRFVQVTLWIVGVALVVLIGGIAWLVLRSVTVPIAQAAETSAKLAAGDLGVRVTVRGEDEIATLGRSFNAMADSIEGQIKELADLSLVQQRFVSDVSHELRTPLTTIRLASDMLNDHRQDFDPTTARAAELLHDQVVRFETLLGDLLEISRYDAGSVQLENEPTSLAHLAEDVIASMHQLAEQNGIDVRLVAPGGYSPVDMDPRRVRRIVRNLLGNAIEHGEGRPVVVTVDSDRHAVALGVRDYGLGMEPEAAERVFDRFWRADPSRKRTIGGTGLGLSIALGDARLHRGRLEVWSQPGRGTHFVLTLPRGAGPLAGSPIPVDPGDDGLDPFGLTQPIHVTERGS